MPLPRVSKESLSSTSGAEEAGNPRRKSPPPLALPRRLLNWSAKVEYAPTGEAIKYYPTIKGARIAATRFNLNAGRRSYCAKSC